MKLILFVLLSLGSFAYGETFSTEIIITKGPYYVPAKNSAFDVFNSDFQSEGEVLVYLTDSTISFMFPRTDLITLKSKKDADADYYSSVAKDLGIRIGLEGNKVTWLFSQSSTYDWHVTILDDAKDAGVAPTPFMQMEDEALLTYAAAVMDKSGAGGFGDDYTINRAGNVITMKASVTQWIDENSDGPAYVGDVTVTITDIDGARSIKAEGSYEVPEQEEFE